MIRVRAPATSANLGSGFDTFGVALDGPADVVSVERHPETVVEVTGVGASEVPVAPSENVVGPVAEALDAPARIRIEKGVRPSSGLGSSAASAAAAAVALDRLYERGRSREELVAVAAEGEAVVTGVAHTDNVAPALLGGFTISGVDGVRTVDAEIPLVVCLPETALRTSDAREVVPESVPTRRVVETIGRAATLAVGMCRSDPELVGLGMVGGRLTSTRARFVAGYEPVREAAGEAGATGVTVSGSGPAMIAACRPGGRGRVADAMTRAFEDAGVGASAYRTGIGRGATVLDGDAENL